MPLGPIATPPILYRYTYEVLTTFDIKTSTRRRCRIPAGYDIRSHGELEIYLAFIELTDNT